MGVFAIAHSQIVANGGADAGQDGISSAPRELKQSPAPDLLPEKRKANVTTNQASKKSTPRKRSTSKKSTPKKSTTPKGAGHGANNAGEDLDRPDSSTVPAAPSPRLNTHRAKIQIGKNALAAIKEGTRES